jgi:hypothetical protein
MPRRGRGKNQWICDKMFIAFDKYYYSNHYMDNNYTYENHF